MAPFYPKALRSFYSMWVQDGNADVDHVATAAGDLAILARPACVPELDTLPGARWFFHRVARSQHNTSAPDILIQALDWGPALSASATVCANRCLIYLPTVLRQSGEIKPGF